MVRKRTTQELRALSDGVALGNPEDLRPALVQLTGREIGKLILLEQEVTVLGREEDCDVVVEDPGVSRRHCRFVLDGRRVLVEDLASRNGVYVNWEKVTGRALQSGDRLRVGERALFKFVRLDETEEAFQQTLYNAAVRDPLTGAYNARFLRDALSAELSFAQRHLTPLSVLLFDVDGFTALNDELGRVAGDRLLVGLVQAVREQTRAEDILARLGPDELAVLGRGLRARHAYRFAERLREIVAGSQLVVDDDGRPVPVTVSVGLATLTPPAGRCTAADLLQRAEDALAAARETGNRSWPVPDDVPSLP